MTKSFRQQLEEILEREFPDMHPAQSTVVPQQIEALVLELIGEDEEIEPVLEDTILNGRNQLRAELRAKVKDTD